MPFSDPLTISLTPELCRFIEAQAVSEQCLTASEVARAGLRLLTRANPPHAIETLAITTPEILLGD